MSPALTLSEALERIDKAIIEIQIRDRHDGRFLPLEYARMKVAEFHGADWQIGSFEADPQGFLKKQLQLVWEYRKYLFKIRMERKLLAQTISVPEYDDCVGGVIAPDPVDAKWIKLFMSWGCSEAHARRALGLDGLNQPVGNCDKTAMEHERPNW